MVPGWQMMFLFNEFSFGTDPISAHSAAEDRGGSSASTR